jgi:hypothetical protein
MPTKSKHTLPSVWVTNSHVSTGNSTVCPTVYVNQIHNNAHKVTNATTNTFQQSVVLINQYLSDVQDNIKHHSDGTGHSTLRRILEGAGVELPDGSRLKIRDGKPVVEHRHQEGSEKLRPVPVSHYGTIDFSDADHILGPGATLKLPDGTYLQTDHDGNMTVEKFINAREKVIDVTSDKLSLYEALAFCHFSDIHIPATANAHATFTLPNGVKINLFPDDHIEIDEKDGRQLYRTEATRGFNKFLNASDLLEEFIAYCAEQKMTRKDFAELPISLFIYWLIVQAAETDGDSTQESMPLLTHAVKEQKFKPSHCKCCGRFLSSKMVSHGINFCSSDHMQRYVNKL